MPARLLKLMQGGSAFMERATDAVAILAVLTGLNPTIYLWISTFSEVAALLLPILGCVWLAVQIYYRVTRGQ